MTTILFDSVLCDLCGTCVVKCPFHSLLIQSSGVTVDETCRMCGVCVKACPQKALSFSQNPIKDNSKKVIGTGF